MSPQWWKLITKGAKFFSRESCTLRFIGKIAHFEMRAELKKSVKNARGWFLDVAIGVARITKVVLYKLYNSGYVKGQRHQPECLRQLQSRICIK